ncbi:MAG: hypothetical protein IT240_04375 [Bacteroidia bacterium]|mgnify:CR=1 FL=1|jgi:hypothetical protein|nr:hypothetical protein [Bacteroidia bacterium]MCC6768255.1 hypothetical protein [Bacteroidia bacterium]
MNSRRQVRCNGCKQWNFTEDTQGQCLHCGNELFPKSKADEESLLRRQQAWNLNIVIHPDDSLLVRMVKKVANVVQLVFLAIISFIMWLIAMSPG